MSVQSKQAVLWSDWFSIQCDMKHICETGTTHNLVLGLRKVSQETVREENGGTTCRQPASSEHAPAGPVQGSTCCCHSTKYLSAAVNSPHTELGSFVKESQGAEDNAKEISSALLAKQR